MKGRRSRHTLFTDTTFSKCGVTDSLRHTRKGELSRTLHPCSFALTLSLSLFLVSSSSFPQCVCDGGSSTEGTTSRSPSSLPGKDLDVPWGLPETGSSVRVSLPYFIPLRKKRENWSASKEGGPLLNLWVPFRCLHSPSRRVPWWRSHPPHPGVYTHTLDGYKCLKKINQRL